MPQYDMDSPITNTISKPVTSFSISEVWIIISILLAVIGGIYLYNTYFNKNKENDYKGITKILYDFLAFKITIIEPFVKVLYLITSIAITLISFYYITKSFISFLSLLVFGNIIVRVSCEFILLILKLFKDVSEINYKKETKENDKIKTD